MFEHHTIHTLRFVQGKTAFCSVKNAYFNKLNEFLSATSVEYLNGIIGKFRSFSELESESKNVTPQLPSQNPYINLNTLLWSWLGVSVFPFLGTEPVTDRDHHHCAFQLTLNFFT